MKTKNGEIKDVVIICEGNTKSPDKKLILLLLKENGIVADKNEIIPIGGKCDFIDKVREIKINREEFLKII